MPLTSKDYRDAIEVQGAVNLSGIAHSLSRVVTRIWEEPDCAGTDWVNTHPIVVLYVEQLVYLSGRPPNRHLKSSSPIPYVQAYRICEERGRKEEVDGSGTG